MTYSEWTLSDKDEGEVRSQSRVRSCTRWEPGTELRITLLSKTRCMARSAQRSCFAKPIKLVISPRVALSLAESNQGLLGVWVRGSL